MARIPRKNQKIFAMSATNNGVFGSAQAGTKVLSNDIEVLQGLAAYLNGWNDATIDSRRFPTLEEMQALDYINTTQLAYIFQEGIPEFNIDTTYYQHSIVKKAGTYELYGSIVDDNVGNALPSGVSDANWQFLQDISSPPVVENATETVAGIAELATQAETNAGTDDERIVTPLKLASRTATESRAGVIEIATQAETNAGADDARSVTPKKLNDRVASETLSGIAEIATAVEALALTDDSTIITPAKLALVLATLRQVPIGQIDDFGGSSAPAGYLLCYGQAISRTTYAPLFAVIGTTFGVGDNVTTFNIPDCRGRIGAGKDNMGGTPAGRLTGQPGGVSGTTIGNAGGSETHQLTVAQLAAHRHKGGVPGTNVGLQPYVYGSTTDDLPGPTNERFSQGSGAATFQGFTSTDGGDGAHNNVQPTIIFNKIIKY